MRSLLNIRVSDNIAHSTGCMATANGSEQNNIITMGAFAGQYI